MEGEFGGSLASISVVARYRIPVIGGRGRNSLNQPPPGAALPENTDAPPPVRIALKKCSFA